jgi:hypothetical protein
LARSCSRGSNQRAPDRTAGQRIRGTHSDPGPSTLQGAVSSRPPRDGCKFCLQAQATTDSHRRVIS